jgi:hypothetical protein
MKRHFIHCALLGALLSSSNILLADSLAVIVNPANKLSAATTAELQRYFKAEKTKTPDGVKLVIVMQEAPRPEREMALKAIYKMTETEYSAYFVEATFTGAVASAPKTFPSGAALKKFVAVTPGAIGYIRDSELDETVKALKIDGKSPADPDYSLKVN